MRSILHMHLRVLLLIILLFPALAQAQSREMGVMIGTMGYRGDLDATMYDTRNLSPALGVLYRRSYSNHWAFKAGVSWGRIEARDSDSDEAWRQNRNLNFRSGILELSGQAEFNFFPYQTSSPFTKASPYVMFGFSLFRFNPKAEINGDWVALNPLRTEGQGLSIYPNRDPYKRTSLAMTYGGGVKFKIMRRFGVAIESGVRRTYTDYLDDVSRSYADPVAILREYGRTASTLSDRSLDQAPGGNIGRQRGDRSKNDWYVFTGVQITYTLSKKYIDSCSPFRIKLW